MYSYWYVKTESGDNYDGHCEILEESEDLVKKNIIKDMWPEIYYWVESRGWSKEYCLDNPNEALDYALLYPTIRFIK